jgi:hypothetical protein
MKRVVLFTATHLAAIAIGFAVGVYMLPIIIAPRAASAEQIAAAAAAAMYTGQFRRDLKGSDFLHWGEGTVAVSPKMVALDGRISAGPAYRLYLAPEFVETKPDFLRIKARSAAVGDVRTFRNFILQVPEAIDVSRYNTVVIWCEAFSQFITAAKYR